MSLRLRLVLSYVLIVVLCLGIAAVSVSVLLQNYRDQVNMTRLDDMTRPIFVSIRSMLVRGQTTVADVWSSVQEQAQRNSVYILFVDDKGNLVRQASPQDNLPNLIVPQGFPHGLTQQAHGLFTTASGAKYVYSAYPLGRALDPLINRPETVILCQPRSSVLAIMTGLINPFIWAGLIALAISLLLAFLVARSVYKPIQRLSRAAENMSQGNYDQEVPISGPPELKSMALSFNKMAVKVKQSQTQLRHFVADVSHQLKSPLTSIQGFAQAILDGTANDSQTRLRATQIISDESRRMIRQVNELLELSRMQAGQLKMAKEPVDIQEVLQRCHEIFIPRLEEKGIKLIERWEATGTIMGDADKLEDVFCNLLDNAIKNAPPQGEVQIISRQGPEHSLAISIADNGPGIPPEQLPYVFERFQQSSGLRGGFGLGLAIAREIVLAHSGKIEVESAPGEGATFRVTFALWRT
jgi:two-component system OmpR family sensor kinase